MFEVVGHNDAKHRDPAPLEPSRPLNHPRPSGDPSLQRRGKENPLLSKEGWRAAPGWLSGFAGSNGAIGIPLTGPVHAANDKTVQGPWAVSD